MPQAQAAPAVQPSGRPRLTSPTSAYAALDLGTNNCRLLIASPSPRGFRVLESYSRIVRLGEGLGQSGRLSDLAMNRTIDALRVCADRIRRRDCVKVRAIATQACRLASNRSDFVEQVRHETGLELEIISAKEEAHLSVAGCVGLLDQSYDAALVIDVGGGSTELSWLELADMEPDLRPRQFASWNLPIRSWFSAPVGVVTLAEQFPETGEVGSGEADAAFHRMVAAVRDALHSDPQAEALRPLFASGRAHMVGTSGAITSLAGLHLGLEKYDRRQVDGIWMTAQECRSTTSRLMAMSERDRAREPCIGADRADLVLAGAAILSAVLELWPCERIRVADRGLREGLLLSLMSEARRPPRRNRRRSGHRKRING